MIVWMKSVAKTYSRFPSVTFVMLFVPVEYGVNLCLGDTQDSDCFWQTGKLLFDWKFDVLRKASDASFGKFPGILSRMKGIYRIYKLVEFFFTIDKAATTQSSM